MGIPVGKSVGNGEGKPVGNSVGKLGERLVGNSVGIGWSEGSPVGKPIVGSSVGPCNVENCSGGSSVGFGKSCVGKLSEGEAS